MGVLNPQYGLSDAAGAIRNGFKQAFEEITNIMYYPHLIRAVRKRLKGWSDEDVSSYMGDIDCIQRAWDEDSFLKAFSLFYSEWTAVALNLPANTIIEELHYFINE